MVLALSTIRENRGISLRDIANETKISMRSLQAIEDGEFQKLPGGTYTTSYIRQYARAIDFDEAAILEVYYRQCASAAPNPVAGHAGKGVPGGYHPASVI